MKKDRLLTVNRWNRKSITSPRNIFDYGGYAAFAQQGANSIPSESTTFGKWEYDNGAFDAADPLFYMTEGRHSKVGDTFDKMAVSAVQTGNPWAALAGAGMKIIGDFINAGWGMKEDTASIDTMNREKAFYKNFESNAKNFDDLVTIPAPYRKAKVYEGGWFTKDDAESKNAAFIKDFDNAYNYALRSVDNNAENIKKDQMSRALANYSAYGGPIGQYGSDDLGAVGYNFMSDYLTMKNNKVNSDSKTANVFQGYPSTFFAFGGDMQSNSADFPTGLTHINAGKSHEENPYDGVQIGVDGQGIPNMVEEGEVVYDDYVYSKRIPVDATTKEKFHLPKKKEISYADLAKKLEKEIKERPNDPLSKAGFEAQMHQLADEQERQKQEMEAERAKEAFEALSSKEQVAVMQRMQQEEALAQEEALQQEQQALAQQATVEQPTEEEVLAAQQQALAEEQQQRVAANGGMLVKSDTEKNLYADGSGLRKRDIRKRYNKDWFKKQAEILGISEDELKGFYDTFSDEDAVANMEAFNKVYKDNQRKAAQRKFLRGKLFNTDNGLYRYSDDKSKILKAQLDENGDRVLDEDGKVVWEIYDGDEDKLLKAYNQDDNKLLSDFSWDNSKADMLQYPNEGNASSFNNWQRYVGAAGPAVGLGMMAAGVGKPNYYDMQAALDIANRAPALGSYTPLGDYITYRPMDIWAEQNRMDANARATDRAITNNGAPVGTKMAGLLANAYNNQIALGNLYRNALEYNDAKRERVAAFNRGTNQYNSDAGRQVSLANAQMMNAAQQYRANLAMQYAKEKMDAEAGWYNSLYGNVNNLFKGIGDIGYDNAIWDMARAGAKDWGNLGNSATGSLYGVSRAKGGKLRRRKNKNSLTI